MILSAQSIRECRILSPFHERTKAHGMTFGLGPCGYDVRIAESFDLIPGAFVLASTIERFSMPDFVVGIVHDKSTWAREGLALQNTVIEPGWCGYLTLELSYHANAGRLQLRQGMPIAQVIFHRLDRATEQPYRGKYQNQKPGAQPAFFDHDGKHE